MKTVSLDNAWKGEADCLSCSLRETVLFSGLSVVDFEKIHNPIDQYMLPAGSDLYHEGDCADYMYTIRSGIVKFTQVLADGNQRIVRLGFSSDIIGLESLFESTYKHRVTVLRDLEVCRLPVTTINQISADNQTLHRELLNRWHQALNEADNWLTLLSTGSSRQRMANLLIMLSKKHGDNCCQLFSREDVGSILGLTTETASRIIAEFKRNNIIKGVGNYYTIDINQLSKFISD